MHLIQIILQCYILIWDPTVNDNDYHFHEITTDFPPEEQATNAPFDETGILVVNQHDVQPDCSSNDQEQLDFDSKLPSRSSLNRTFSTEIEELEENDPLLELPYVQPLADLEGDDDPNIIHLMVRSPS